MAVIREQLKREPRGVLGVNRYCKHGFPQVITSRPLAVNGARIEIFPTLYWLTCPYLHKELAQLEGNGLISEFEQRIEDDPEFAAAVNESHADYAERRLDLIPAEVQERMRVEYPKRFRVLAESGVGGTRTPQGVKCLHAHMADYLVHGENAVGAAVVKILDKCLSCQAGLCQQFLVDEGI